MKRLVRWIILILLIGIATYPKWMNADQRQTMDASQVGQIRNSLSVKTKQLFSQLQTTQFEYRPQDYHFENRWAQPKTETHRNNETSSSTPLMPNVRNLALNNTYYYNFKEGTPQAAIDVFYQAIKTYNDTGIVNLIPGQASRSQNSVTMGVYDDRAEDVGQNYMSLELGKGGPETYRSALGGFNHGVANLNAHYQSSFAVSVATHELGHAMGLGHSQDRSSLMYPTDQGVTQLSEADLTTLRAIYNK